MSPFESSAAPFFSIIIPAYNSAATLAEAIDSALAQTCRDFEIIVVNDGSTDATAEVIAAYRDRVRAIAQDNRGLAAARNTAARNARGLWLALLDADDSWALSKLERIKSAITLNPEAVMFFSDAECFDLDCKPMDGLFMPRHLVAAPSWDDMLAGRSQILPSSAVVNAQIYNRLGGFCEDFKGASGFEDVDFWLRLRELGPFFYLPEPLVKYRVAPLAVRLERYRPGFKVFCKRVRERYGRDGERLIQARRKARVSLWTRVGKQAEKRGEMAAARSAFRRALREDPLQAKNLLRLLRTFLPGAIGSMGAADRDRPNDIVS